MAASPGRTEVEAPLYMLANKSGVLETRPGPGLKRFGLGIHQKAGGPAAFQSNPGKMAGLNKCLYPLLQQER